MRQRVATAAVGVPLLLATGYLGGPYWALVVAALGVLGTGEFIRIARRIGFHACRWFAIFGSLGLVALAYYFGETGLYRGLVLLTMAAAAGIVFSYRRRRPADWVLSLWGVLYPGAFLSFTILLRNQPSGALYLITLLLITWANDTGAYFAGRWWGHRKLTPSLSPHKTWAGAAGGVGLVLLVAGAIFFLWPVPFGSPSRWLGRAGILALAGQLGDLAESAWKREAGLKDAGTLLPGHGGILDRFDGFIFMAPLAYYFSVL